jgi:tight adherence protein C
VKPHLFLGIDLMTAATMMSAAAVFALLVALYTATTVRDPMAKRVKALNERREQLKAGITASTRKRARLTRSSQTTDRMRALLASFKVLQDTQLKDAQEYLMHDGMR